MNQRHQNTTVQRRLESKEERRVREMYVNDFKKSDQRLFRQT